MSTHQRSFPVTSSLLSTGALAALVERVYDVGTPTACVYWSRGPNDVYIVQAGARRYVLRVSRSGHRTRGEIRYELDLVKYLDRQGIPVATPIEKRDRRLVHSLKAPEGVRHLVLFHYVTGAEEFHDLEDFVLFGHTVARAHNAMDDFSSPYSRPGHDLGDMVEETAEHLRSLLRHRQADECYISKLVELLRNRKSEFLAERLDVGVCHGDVHAGNCGIDDGIATMFDFDECGSSWRAYDLATFRWSAIGQDDAIWHAFLRGYRSSRPLVKADLCAVPVLVVLRQLWYMAEIAKNADLLGGRYVSDAFLDTNLRFLRRWIKKEKCLS